MYIYIRKNKNSESCNDKNTLKKIFFLTINYTKEVFSNILIAFEIISGL